MILDRQTDIQTDIQTDRQTALSQLEYPQSECLLLRHCHVPTLNYLARSVSPSLFQSTAKIHDNMT